MQSLKAELRGETFPEFALTLPDGWIRQEPTDDAKKGMIDAARARLMSVHRPDLFAQTLSLLNRAFADMKRTETVAYFIAAPDAPDDAYLPASLTASIRRGENGASLDASIAQLIRTEGATSLGGDKKFLRWEQVGTETLDGVKLTTTTVVYLTPIPGSGRTRALQFTLVFTHGPDGAEGDSYIDSLKALFDAHLSTFAWTGA